MGFRRSDSKVEKKNINSNQCFKYAAAISVSMTTVGLGIIFSWTSPSLPYLQSPASNFPVSEIQGAWITSIVGCGTVSGFLINPILINKLGSKKTLLFLASPQILSWALIYFGKNWLLLCFARIIGGFGYGAGMCSTAIYLSEIGNKNTRGIFLTLIKMSVNIGIFITMFLGAFLSYDAMNLVLLSIPVIFVVTFFSMPDATQFREENDFEESVRKKLIENGFDDVAEKQKKDFEERLVKKENCAFEGGKNCLNEDVKFLNRNRSCEKNVSGFNENEKGSNGFKKNINGLDNITVGITSIKECSLDNTNAVTKNENGSDMSANGIDKIESNNTTNRFEENSNRNSKNGLNKDTPDLDKKLMNLTSNNVVDVVKEDTIFVMKNNTIVIVNEDTVDVIESQTVDILNENTNCLLTENSLNFLNKESQTLLKKDEENFVDEDLDLNSQSLFKKDTLNFLKENSTCASGTIILPKETVTEKNLSKKEETFDEEIHNLLRNSQKNIWWQLFFIKNNRKAFLIIMVASLTDILSGHMAIVSYTQQIFEYSGASLKAEYAALILAVLKIVASLISALVVEKFERRNLFLTTGILAGLSQGFVGLFFFLKFYLKIDVVSVTWLPLLGVSMYEVVGSVGLSSLYYVYQGELFSDDVKGLGVTCTNIFYEVITFFVKLYFQIVIDTFGIYSIFWGFGICCIVGSYITYWISPKTKGKSKEEIQKLLGAR